MTQNVKDVLCVTVNTALEGLSKLIHEEKCNKKLELADASSECSVQWGPIL